MTGASSLLSEFSHSFAGMFTPESITSLPSLSIGDVSVFISGALGGTIIAHCYNLCGRWFGE